VLDEEEPLVYVQKPENFINNLVDLKEGRDHSTPGGDQDRLETEEDRGLMFTSFID
jgi:hypothetical protein